ncbi:MAG: 1-acyl-sn-glycerol-3-phosphate acyltransferase [Spirochaetaceae bacterium]|jgi:glycerol-3-phosphate O-acyltransferase|nr:1-acyl-sn-glycerol-3-phosphate acyltransferase [Spirochaetaceae bacterium]
MDGLTLKERYADDFAATIKNATAAAVIDETNVYQEYNPFARKVMDRIVRENLLPGSRLEGKEHFQDFYRQIQGGKRGVIFCEHYSNLDLPIIMYLLEHDGGDFGAALAQRAVSIAGMKLNEDDPGVRSFAEGYTRIIIYPSRSLAGITDEAAREREGQRSRKINMAAMRALYEARRDRRPVVVFPSGTRYRPGRSETKRGLREIDSYLRIFDIMLLVTLNGQCLRFNPADPDNMVMDLMFADRMIVAASPVMGCRQFRDGVLSELGDNPEVDVKQAVVDRLMELLERRHGDYEKVWLAEKGSIG